MDSHFLRCFAAARQSGVLLVTLLFSLSAHADYVWLERDGATARAYLGELQPDRPPASAELLGDARAFMADNKSLATTMTEQHYTIANLREGGDLRFTAKRQASSGGLLFYQANSRSFTGIGTGSGGRQYLSPLLEEQAGAC
jgi:hypothetical protein